MSTASALVRAFDRTAFFICGVLVTALLVCVSLGALTRSLGNPLIWTDELSRFLMVWLAVFGWIAASRKRIHVRIRYFQDRLPRKAHAVVELAIQAAMALFGALVAVYGAGLIGKNHDLDATTLPISMAWMYAPMVLGGATMALQGTAELAETLVRWRRASRSVDSESVVE